ncbi:Fic family protein [Cronobacter sakazakii]|nr:Fic family protein [Cronobacter sakazakii]HDU8042776.1 Fic family protein [Cronobacter sakazakii]
MIFDPFGDFETAGYLQNTLGLKNPTDVKQSEHFVFELGIEEALQFLAEQATLDYAAILKVHEILFSGFYPWAGHDRHELAPDLAIFKGSAENPRHTVFAHPKEIKRAVDYALQLASDSKRFRKRPGEVMGVLALAHPFLDGNGRTLLLFYMELSYRAGFSINWSRTHKDDYLSALSAEIDDPSKGCLDGYLQPFVVDISSRDEWPEMIGGIKGLDGLDKENITYQSLDNPDIQNLYLTRKYYFSENSEK